MGETDRPTILIVSAVHDYRMHRRGSIQAIADAFVRAGFRTQFLSVRFSALSIIKQDSRTALRERANRSEICNGVECYLWRTPLHAFGTGSALGNMMTLPLHDICAAWPNEDVDRMFAAADVVMVESGMGVLFVPRIRRLNPRATLIYRASDTLDAIGAHPALQLWLERHADKIDHFCLLARAMAPQFGFAPERTYCLPQAIQPEDYTDIGANPYTPGRHNAVSVGAMRFDASFFEIAAEAFPNVDFHLIGCGTAPPARANVFVHPEMPFREMLPFVRHANIGVAAYLPAPMGRYLAESSLKLTQFAYLGIPAVCPHFAVGASRNRFGYTPGAASEIVAAIERAMAHRFDASDKPAFSWDDLVPRFLRPAEFADVRIAAAEFHAVETAVA